MSKIIQHTDKNIGNIFETLCRKLVECIIEHKKSDLKRIKSVIAHNFLNNEELKKELSLYNAILENKFRDKGIARSFINEVYAQAKAVDKSALNTQVSKLINESSTYIDIQNLSNNKLYEILYENISYLRKSNHTIEESSKFYKNTESLIDHLVIEEQEKKPTKEGIYKLDKFTYNHAVKKFNEKYDTLSESQKEIIEDFLMYKSSDRFKKSLLKRLKVIGEQLRQIKKTSPKSIQNIESLEKKITEYYKASSNGSDESVHNMMLNVCELSELCEELKQFSSQSKETKNNN